MIAVLVPNLKQDTDIQNILRDFANDSLVDGSEYGTIYNISTLVLRLSYSFTLEPLPVTYHPVNKVSINRIY